MHEVENGSKTPEQQQRKNMRQVTFTFWVPVSDSAVDVFDVVQRLEPIPCPVDGCLSEEQFPGLNVKGLYASRHSNCGGRGCDSPECSTLEKHGMAGRLVCKFCAGDGCKRCFHTGLFLKQCSKCKGKGQLERSRHVFTQKSVNPTVVHRKKESKEDKKTSSKPVRHVSKKDTSSSIVSLGETPEGKKLELLNLE